MKETITTHSLQWRNNGHDCVSNHKPDQCSFNRSFGRRSKKTSKLRVTGLWAGNSPGTGDFPAQMASNAENVSISWRHRVISMKETITTRYSNVTWASRCLKSPANLLFVQQMVQADTKTSSDLLVICVGNPPVTDGFPSQRASTAESVSMSWRCHSSVLEDNLWLCTAVITMITTVA